MSETTIREKIAQGRYENKLPYSLPVEPVDEERMTVRQAREHKEAQTIKRREQHNLYRAEDARLNALFKADLEEDFGLTGHPKASKLFEIAWQEGHSGGYGEVVNYYEETCGAFATMSETEGKLAGHTPDDDLVYYDPPECSAEHCRDPNCPYPHYGAWFVTPKPAKAYESKEDALEAARAVNRDPLFEEMLKALEAHDAFMLLHYRSPKDQMLDKKAAANWQRIRKVLSRARSVQP